MLHPVPNKQRKVHRLANILVVSRWISEKQSNVFIKMNLCVLKANHPFSGCHAQERGATVKWESTALITEGCWNRNQEIANIYNLECMRDDKTNMIF